MPTEDVPVTPKGRGRTLPITIIGIAAGLAAWQLLDSVLDSDPTSPVVLAELVQSGAAAGYNVLLITLDTTRPDHLGC